MAKKGKIYKCEICGNIVEVLEEGAGTLVCCGQNMTELSEKTEDQGQEKHVPIIEINGNKAKVKVGSIPHPMEETHYIQFIQLLIDENIYTKYLKPGQLPEAEFEIPTNYKEISAREYCNIHGLWKSK
jgi:superoxide reductase